MSYVAVKPGHWLLPPPHERFWLIETAVVPLAGVGAAGVLGTVRHGAGVVVKLHSVPDNEPLASLATTVQ